MIADLLQRDVILRCLEDMQTVVATDNDESLNPDERVEIVAALQTAEQLEKQESSGQQGFDEPGDGRRRVSATLDDRFFISHDPVVCLLQSAIEERISTEYPDRILKPESTSRSDRRSDAGDVATTDECLREPLVLWDRAERRLFNKFSITDIRWIRSKVAEGIRHFKGKHPFNSQPAPAVTLPSRARLIVVGDWGSGLPRALKVAQQIRAVLDSGKQEGLDQHLVHLGDVYYSGWPKEYERHFTPHWPVRSEEANEIRSWNLNSNHDMYCGGQGYFGLLRNDVRFALQNKSSFFSLVHPKWKILGLDTAWEHEHGSLYGPQVDWLQEELKDNGRKRLLLSHHQLFSPYEKTKGTLAKQIEPVLARSPAKAWFWGHEHRCLLLDAAHGVEFPRCVGDGGIPVYSRRRPADAYEPPIQYEHSGSFSNGLERWALFGFAVLDFYDEVLNVRYIDENGYQHHRESIA